MLQHAKSCWLPSLQIEEKALLDDVLTECAVLQLKP